MTRKARFLEPTSTNSIPHEAIWFDTETTQHQIDDDTVEHRLMFGWAAYRRRVPSGGWSSPKWFRFDTVTAFWDWVVSLHRPKTRLYMFCHNTNFDLPVLDTFVSLPQRGYRMTLAVIDAPPTILRFSGEARTIVVLDTLNIWRMPLARLGETVGICKLSFPSSDDPPDVWDTYAKRDVEVIMEACLKWWEFLSSNDMGGFANTLAAQSLLTYRHKYMRAPIFLDDNPKALELSRSCYMGARTECFKIGTIEEELYLVDINSQYPSVMESKLFPTILKGYSKHCDTASLGRWLKEGRVCADVEVNTDEPVYPCIIGKKLCFPVGRFRAHLCSGELEYALQRDNIDNVHRAAIYSQDDIFSRFVTDIYRRRIHAMESADSVHAGFLKILMNSLYGKFGQNGLVYEREDDTSDLTARVWTELDAVTGKVIRWRQFGGMVQRQEQTQESRNSHPAIAAHVTSYGRMLLWQIMQEAGKGNYFYCDTDSLLVNAEGYANLTHRLDNKRLGMLKLELTCDGATIHGPKDYVIGDRTKTKGVKRNAVWTGPSEVTQEKWSSLRGLLSSGSLTNPTTKTITKKLRRVYNKGMVAIDGWVEPIRLGGYGPDPKL